MKTSKDLGLIAAALLAFAPAASASVELKGSPASMVHQHAIAVQEDYSFLGTPTDIRNLVSDGKLMAVKPNADFTLAGVSFPFTRPEVEAFIRRYASDYHDSTGVMLTVTSLTRPESLQPKNAHVLSVHPAGMAVDFRVPATPQERVYLERTLLAMERSGLLDVTRELHPAHYHVAVFAEPMLAYLAVRDSADAVVNARLATQRATMQRNIVAVPSSSRAIDSMNESRLPLFALAMLALLGLAAPLLHSPREAHSRA